MHMTDKSLQNKGKAGIRTLAIGQDSVLGDVVNGQVLHGWNIDFGWIDGKCRPKEK